MTYAKCLILLGFYTTALEALRADLGIPATSGHPRDEIGSIGVLLRRFRLLFPIPQAGRGRNDIYNMSNVTYLNLGLRLTFT
jgi:hypothetical protein